MAKRLCASCVKENLTVLNIFLYSCTMFKNYVNDMFNYVCKDILIDNFEYMTIENKWQVILTESGDTDFNIIMWVPLGCKIASRMFDLLRKKKVLCRGDQFDNDIVTQ